MCGRFTLTIDPDHLQEAFPWAVIPDDIYPRYNIAPSQPIAVIPNTGENTVAMYKWGLIPSWAKDPEIGNKMINARAESLAEKPSFRNAFRRRRCLILADGFYEWKQIPGSKSKQPVFIKLTNDRPFAFAGLWELWSSPDGSEIRSCTIITTEPNSLIKSIHNRMPAILIPESYKQWLATEEQPADKLNKLIISYPSEEMIAYPVSRLVNKPDYDSSDLIKPTGNL
jgi:putative SOS response-associated peptidase YedK